MVLMSICVFQSWRWLVGVWRKGILVNIPVISLHEVKRETFMCHFRLPFSLKKLQCFDVKNSFILSIESLVL